MNRSKLFYVIKNALDAGCSVDFGRLTICNLGDYIPLRGDLERKYQVHCDDRKMLWSEIYFKQDIAIDKFLLIRNVIGELDDSFGKSNRGVQVVQVS